MRSYSWLLRWTLRLRWAVLLAVLPFCGWEIHQFFSRVERGWGGGESSREVEVKVVVPRAFTEAERRALFSRLEQVVLAHREELDLARLTTSFQPSAEAPQSNRRRRWGQDSDSLELLLHDEGADVPGERRELAEVRARLKQLLPETPGVLLQLGASRRMGGGGARSVSVLIEGRSVQELLAPAQAVADALRGVPGVDEVELSDELGGAVGIEVRPRRLRAARFGVRAQTVGQAISASLGERTVARLRGTEREIEVVVRPRERDRASVDDLRRTPVARVEAVEGGTEGEAVSAPSPAGAPATLEVGSLAEVQPVPAPRQIKRVDRRTVVAVNVSVLEGQEEATVAQALEEQMRLQTLPRGVRWRLGRNVNRWRQGESENQGAALLAFVLVLMLLCALFESYVDALAIAVTVPFALVGVAWAFRATDTKLDSIAWIGLMILIGIVVNHGIVLVDRVRRLLSEGLPPPQALLQGGRDRLRPIVMTAATTVLGLLPIVAQHLFPDTFRGDSGAQVYGPIGLGVASGLIVSTALTLLVLPALLAVIFEARAALGAAAGLPAPGNEPA